MPEPAHRRPPAAADPLLGAAAGATAIAEVVGALHRPAPWTVTIAAAVAVAIGIGVRRIRPLGALLAVAVCLLAGGLLGGHTADTDSTWLAAALLVYTAAAHRPLGPAAFGLIVMVIVATACETLLGNFDPAPAIVLLVPPFACGRALRHWRLLTLALADTAAALEAGREAHAALAVADERARIARELHDVVGHAVSLIVVQATAGRRVAGERPGDAWRALDAIDLAGAQATEELARLAAVVDATPETLAAVIAPAIAAGLRVAVRADPPGPLDDLAIRIVQEALTNTLKHAGPTDVQIDVHEGPESMTIRIADRGPRAGGRRAAIGSGDFGLVGMRERLAAAGGTLAAGPRTEGGWEVRACVPRVLPADDQEAATPAGVISAAATASDGGQPTRRAAMKAISAAEIRPR